MTGVGFDRLACGHVLFCLPTAREERTASKSQMGRPVGPWQRIPIEDGTQFVVPRSAGTTEVLTRSRPHERRDTPGFDPEPQKG